MLRWTSRQLAGMRRKGKIMCASSAGHVALAQSETASDLPRRLSTLVTERPHLNALPRPNV